MGNNPCWWCRNFQAKKEPLVVVSRGSTRSEKMQIADLPPGTMRRISMARSIVSGVELWHPAKLLLENRVEFVHCIGIIICCLSKTIFAKPVLFSKTPHLYSNTKTGSPEYFVLAAIGLQTVRLKQIKDLIILAGAVERAVSTRTTTPRKYN